MDENGRPLTEAEAEFQEFLSSVFAETESNSSLMDNLFPSGPTNNVSQSAEQFPPTSSMNQTLEPPSHLELERPSIPDGGLVSQVNSEIANVLIPASESGNQALYISGFQGNSMEEASLSAEDYSFQLTAIEDQTLQASRSAGPKPLQNIASTDSAHSFGQGLDHSFSSVQVGFDNYVDRLQQSNDVKASTSQTAQINPVSGGAASSILNRSNRESAEAGICRRVIGENCDHSIIHTRAKPFVCDICKRSFKTNAEMKVHRRIHTGEKPFVCDICKRSFKTNAEMKVHRRIHTGEKPFVCDICKKSFNRSSHMKLHRRVHTGEKPIVCDICKRSFQQSSHMKVHRRIHTGEKPFVCDICTRSFKTNAEMKVHRRIHTGEKPFVCDICTRSFKRSSEMKLHRRIHTGEKPFVCDICKKSFKTSSHMKVHRRIHTGEKPFVCEFCKKGFTNWSNLESHVRTHTGEKRFVCSLCKRSFRQNNHLQCHLRTHTEERPYICGTCGQCFKHPSTLSSHQKQAHTEKTFFCYTCPTPRCFHSIEELDTHIKHHNTKCPLTGNCKKIYSSGSGLGDHKKKCIEVGAVEPGSFETVVRDDGETLYGGNDRVTASRDSGDTQVAGFSGNLVNMSDINTTPVFNAGPFPTTLTNEWYVIRTLEGVPSVVLDGQLSSTQDTNSSGEQSNFNTGDQIDFEADKNGTRPKRQ